MVEAQADRSIVISGDVQGDLEIASAFSAVITQDASVHGNVHVAEGATLVIAGVVQGDVTTLGSVRVERSADIQGNITGATG
jgi:cytoskeletal protein CcmA (bactofilin family)